MFYRFMYKTELIGRGEEFLGERERERERGTTDANKTGSEELIQGWWESHSRLKERKREGVSVSAYGLGSEKEEKVRNSFWDQLTECL